MDLVQELTGSAREARHHELLWTTDHHCDSLAASCSMPHVVDSDAAEAAAARHGGRLPRAPQYPRSDERR